MSEMTKNYILENNPEIENLWQQITTSDEDHLTIGFESKNEAISVHINLHMHRKTYAKLLGVEDEQYKKMALWKISNPQEKASIQLWILRAEKRTKQKLNYKILD